MNSLSVIQIAVDGFDDNFSYLIIDEKTKQVALVDPCGKIERVYDEIKKCGLALSATLITHSHFDHVERLPEVLKNYSIPVYVHKNAEEYLTIPNGSALYVQDNDRISIGKGNITVFYTPGHIADAVCYFIPAKEVKDNIPKLITGDTLFVEGCGRTTEAQVKELYTSLEFIKTLPLETEVYPGHDYGSKPVSTIAWEKKKNKYFLAKNFEEFKKMRLP